VLIDFIMKKTDHTHKDVICKHTAAKIKKIGQKTPPFLNPLIVKNNIGEFLKKREV